MIEFTWISLLDNRRISIWSLYGSIYENLEGSIENESRPAKFAV